MLEKVKISASEQQKPMVKVKNKKKLSMMELQDYSLMLIPLLLIFVFNYIPMFGIIIAFKDYRYGRGIFGSEWVGLDNFKFFFQSDTFTRITWNTLSLNFIFIVTGTIAAVLTAILLYNLKSRNATKVYQTAMITPRFISWVIAAYVVYAFLNPNYGFLNQILAKMGVPTIEWYSEAKYWPAILTIVTIWHKLGVDCVMYYAALMGIDKSLFEAAEVDGANKLRVTWHIILPELTSLIVMLTILSIGGIFRADFGLFYNVPRNISLLYETTDVVDTYIFRSMREIGDMGMSSAVGLLQSIVGFVLVVTVNAITNKINPDNALF